MVVTSTICSNNNTLNYSNTKVNNKKAREGKIVSPVNCTVRINVNNQNNESEYKNINDWVEYINSGDGKKNKKKKNLSKKKKNNNKKIVVPLKSGKENKLANNNRAPVSETDSEIEEFKNKIKTQSIKAILVNKVKPQFSDKWLKLLKNILD